MHNFKKVEIFILKLNQKIKIARDLGKELNCKQK